MVVKAETIGPRSNTLGASENGIVLDGSVQAGAGEGHVPKIRKPYTITKQRERWTEDEHKKFLEALKLYGRAWRKIEEHVGTKTAVQIRSHAQKFFSKVVRESSSSNTVSVEAIEIPPPRPKRKPIHPYPRKLVPNPRKESPADHPARSTSPHSSLSEQENQSPTSVLSAVISDMVGSADSTPNDSPSLSSANFVSQVEFSTPQDELHLCKTATEDDVSVKLELFPYVDAVDKEGVDCGKVVKLFGRDLVVPNKLSNNTLRCSDMDEGVLQSSQDDSKCIDLALGISECSWNEFENKSHHMGGGGNQVERPIPLPWWVFFKDMPMHPFVMHPEEAQEKDAQREGSCAGSNSGSVTKADKSWDAETQSSLEPIQEKKAKAAALLEKRSSIEKSPKGGFVPYKRCLSERDLTSSSITSGEKAGQRIRLCL